MTGTFQFVTCANEKYFKFIAPFVFSSLHAEPDSTVEIFVSDLELYRREYTKSLNFLSKMYSDRFKLTQVDFNNILPNTVRFINAPSRKTDYVYIVDIDIFWTESNIFRRLLDIAEESGQDFANIVRPDTSRLSGLHFAKWESMYPIPCLDDINLRSSNDEAVLFKIVTRKIGVEPRRDLTLRPVWGIHMSPNRPMVPTPDRKLSWGINPVRAKQFLTIVLCSKWSEFFSTFPDSQQKEFKLMFDECFAQALPSMFSNEQS